MSKTKVLAYIPARAGSKRIKNKNIRNFLGKPLLYYAIKQARDCGFADYILVDTDSPKTAELARRFGAKAPWLRPKNLSGDKAQAVDCLLYALDRLKKEESYQPDYVMILQTTSPLREMEDIKACWTEMKKGKADTILTVAPTHPRLYYLGDGNKLILANRQVKNSTNIQAWRSGYVLNGCFVYIVKTSALLKEKMIITKNTRAVICDKWRSVDLDEPEDWVLAEFLYKNKKNIGNNIKKMVRHG